MVIFGPALLACRPAVHLPWRCTWAFFSRCTQTGEPRRYRVHFSFWWVAQAPFSFRPRRNLRLRLMGKSPGQVGPNPNL